MLTLPALFDINSFSFKAQSNKTVRVLVNPEKRGTFLPNSYPAGLGGDFDQIDYPLAIASGKVLNAIDPEQAKFKRSVFYRKQGANCES